MPEELQDPWFEEMGLINKVDKNTKLNFVKDVLRGYQDAGLSNTPEPVLKTIGKKGFTDLLSLDSSNGQNSQLEPDAVDKLVRAFLREMDGQQYSESHKNSKPLLQTELSKPPTPVTMLKKLVPEAKRRLIEREKGRLRNLQLQREKAQKLE